MGLKCVPVVEWERSCHDDGNVWVLTIGHFPDMMGLVVWGKDPVPGKEVGVGIYHVHSVVPGSLYSGPLRSQSSVAYFDTPGRCVLDLL